MADPFDPFGAWREALQKWEKDANAALTAATADEGVSRAMSQSLSVLARVQARHGEVVEEALGRANLPSRADFRQLNGRLDAIDRQLANLTAMMAGLAPTREPARGTSVPKPARTRQPPSARSPRVADPAAPSPDSASAPKRRRASPRLPTGGAS